MKRYIGIDGGGTHSSAVAATADGHILARASGSGLNYLNDGLEICVRRFAEIVSKLLSSEDDGSTVTVSAGLAALDGPASPEILSAFQAALPTGCRLILDSDLAIALAGHTRGKPGLMAVCGTGSMVLVRNEAGQEQTAGGWGWKIGDPGSGFMLAREGLFRGFFRLNTEKKETPLLKAALTFFSAPDSQSLIPILYAPEVNAAGLAGFGAEVVRLAERGDPDAQEILSRQMEQLSCLAASLLRSAPEAASCVGLFGGVFQHSDLARSLFSKALSVNWPGVRPGLPEYPPALGAIILAMLQDGVPSDALPAFK